MTSFNSGAQPQNRAPQSIGFLLLDNFTLISLASAVEPLRMANQLSGRELYRWTTLSVDGNQVWASDGLQITPDCSMHKAPVAALIDLAVQHQEAMDLGQVGVFSGDERQP